MLQRFSIIKEFTIFVIIYVITKYLLQDIVFDYLDKILYKYFLFLDPEYLIGIISFFWLYIAYFNYLLLNKVKQNYSFKLELYYNNFKTYRRKNMKKILYPFFYLLFLNYII